MNPGCDMGYVIWDVDVLSQHLKDCIKCLPYPRFQRKNECMGQDGLVDTVLCFCAVCHTGLELAVSSAVAGWIYSNGGFLKP